MILLLLKCFSLFPSWNKRKGELTLYRFDGKLALLWREYLGTRGTHRIERGVAFPFRVFLPHKESIRLFHKRFQGIRHREVWVQ